tara:strand:+ start:215642 stop:215932 length:291 start_codon:yes stop_codon:yes gene_type:complete
MGKRNAQKAVVRIGERKTQDAGSTTGEPDSGTGNGNVIPVFFIVEFNIKRANECSRVRENSGFQLSDIVLSSAIDVIEEKTKQILSHFHSDGMTCP